MEVRLEQSLKTYLPMVVTEFGIIIEERLEHPLKAQEPMEVIEFGIVMEIRLEHPSKTLSSMTPCHIKWQLAKMYIQQTTTSLVPSTVNSLIQKTSRSAMTFLPTKPSVSAKAS